MKLPVGLLLALLCAGCGSGSDALQLRTAPSAVPTTTPTSSPSPSAATALPVATLAPTTPAATALAATTRSPAAAGTGQASSSPLSSVSPSPSASSSPRPSPTPLSTVLTVGDADSGKTVQLRRGQRLRVRLSQGTWDPPVSSAEQVVTRRSTTGGYPTGQPVDATFEGVAAGRADVSAQSDAACFHTTPRCLMPTRLWQLHVVVA